MDNSAPPRMMLKIDFEKSFDRIEWNVILATLQRMCFPVIWINWNHSCLSSTSFSFVLNGHHSSWISSSRGVRQGDPISPLLFLLVLQNLSAIFNKAISLNLVPGCNNNLPRNYNHLIFADDLLLVTFASRKNAHNILLYLNLFYSLSGQKVNLKKS